LEGLGRIVMTAGSTPVLAIGGITAETVAFVMGEGAYGVAVLSGVWDRERADEAVLELLREIMRNDDG
jgi:thiamine monophosphate synthase